MTQDAEPNAAEDPGFFDGRYLVEIETWDWNLHLAVSRESMPPEYRFQGGLDYVKTFELEGRIAGPEALRNQRIRVWLSPFGPDTQFDVENPDGVGRIWRHNPPKYGVEYSATLRIPEASVAAAATCLASVWRYLHMWTFDEDGDELALERFAFSRDIPPKIASWAGSTDTLRDQG